jgi:hypothetical protein
MVKIVRLVKAGPGPQAAEAIANAKRILRRDDIRALAVVFVGPNGNVGTLYGGHREGHYHQLRSGVDELRERFSWGEF